MDRVAARDAGAQDNLPQPPPEPALSAAATGSPAAVSQVPPVSVAPGKAVNPRPPRKPVEARNVARLGPDPGDPVPLDGDVQAPAAPGPELALAAPVPAPLEPAPEALIEPDPYASVPMLWQLPSVIRTKLPKLSMSVHVYAPEAPGRFVIVDRKKYREGDVLKGGVRLEAIVADGIVLDYQGQRYRLGN
jgi:general secretion pathway protein B